MNSKKIELGQYFTTKSIWLKPQIEDFIRHSDCIIAYDPFAGNGDLLKAAKEMGFKETRGCDIDNSLQWNVNDSLQNIPHIDNAIIITNPPYLAKQSASRKKIDLSKYWNNTFYDDLYLIALDQMIKAQSNVVAIIPESFINSSYERKDLLNSITILEDNPFLDTECPVCVACFDGISKDRSNICIYKNNNYVGTLKEIDDVRLEPSNNINITFNDLKGWLGLRAIDSTNDKTFIKFDFKENIEYDWEHRIKVSSRHYSLINIDIPTEKREAFINKTNEILNNIRKQSFDILLTPFMGNTHNGMRRRRLDFRLARAIIESAYSIVCVDEIKATKKEKETKQYGEQLTLF